MGIRSRRKRMSCSTVAAPPPSSMSSLWEEGRASTHACQVFLFSSRQRYGGVRGTHRRPHCRDPLPHPREISLSFQVRLQALAEPHRRPRQPQEARPAPRRLLLQLHQPEPVPENGSPLRQCQRERAPSVLPLLRLPASLPGPRSNRLLQRPPSLLLARRLDHPRRRLIRRVQSRNTAVGGVAGRSRRLCWNLDCTVGAARLGFNPAVSSHFHVFLLLEDARRYLSGVYVYSSETGRWIYKEKGWDEDVWLADPLSATVFVNGCLHFRTVCGLDLQRTCLAAVDTNGGTWSRFDAPCGLYGSDPYLAIIQQSQGRLHYACFNTGGDYDEIQLEVYSLDDYAKKEWILKHRVGEHSSNVEIFGAITNGDFNWIAIHPERNLIFFIETPDKALMSYSMDGQKVGFGGKLREGQTPYLPYVPLYSELESLCM
uniref:Uncharacterized protein n=1 Tax=Avena sativa TaxID=4498 RepID=A0ACD5Z7Z7_AVESA